MKGLLSDIKFLKIIIKSNFSGNGRRKVRKEVDKTYIDDKG